MATVFYRCSIAQKGNCKNFTFQESCINNAVVKYNTHFSKDKRMHIIGIGQDAIDMVVELRDDNVIMTDLRTVTKFLSVLKDEMALDNNQYKNMKFKCLGISKISLDQFNQLTTNQRSRYNLLKELSKMMGSSEVTKDGIRQLDEGTTSCNIEDTHEIKEKFNVSEKTKKDILRDQINRLDVFIDNMSLKMQQDKNLKVPCYLFNTVIAGPQGTGKSSIAKAINNKMLSMGLTNKNELIAIDIDKISPYQGIKNILEREKRGIVYLDRMESILKNGNIKGENRALDTIIADMEQFRNQFIFILGGEQGGIEKLIEISSLNHHIKFFIQTPDFNDDELFNIAKDYAQNQGYSIEDAARERFIELINNSRREGVFKNTTTVNKLIEDAIVNKNSKYNGFELDDNQNLLTKDDFITPALREYNALDTNCCNNQSDDKDPIEELESLIGLEEVKEKVRDIITYLSIQSKRKQLGIKHEPICLHMEFTGNPGTGKTTVARLLGDIFKKIGVLESGQFIEVGREHLVGQYIGHTARKTAEVISKAQGGVLFIDEAYSLYNEGSRDFGYEAVSTLIRSMENAKDKFAVILAGYSDEMKLLINMNPGLADRIQYKIHFPDYRPEDLVKIFHKFCKENDYVLDEGAAKEINKIMRTLYHNRGRNFSNGRLVRKCFERVKVFQSRRVLVKELASKEELVTIKLEDVELLYQDANIGELMTTQKKRAVGFI